MIKDKALKAFTKEVREAFGIHLKRLLLFGSRARGDFTEWSDYDILLVFDLLTPEMEEKVEEIGDRMLLEYDALFTTFSLTEADLERRRFEPFLMNAKKEGIPL